MKIWDYTNGKVIKILNFNNYVSCISNKPVYKSKGRNKYKNYIAIGTATGEIIVINKKTYKQMHSFKDNKEIKIIRFYDYGVMTVNIDNKIKFWTVEFE